MKTTTIPEVKKNIINVLYFNYANSSLKKANQFLSLKAPHINFTTIKTEKILFQSLVKKNNFGILLIEQNLPDEKTIKLFSKLRIKGLSIPLIVLIEQGKEEFAMEALKIGASDFIVKTGNYLEHMQNLIETYSIGYKFEQKYLIEHERELELQKSQKILKELSENAGIVFWIREIDSKKVTYISPSYESLSGRNCESFYSDTDSWEEIVHPDDLIVFMDKLSSRVESKTEFIHRIVTTSGETKWVKTESYPLKDNSGKITRILGTVQDITQFKEVEHSLIKTTERLNFIISENPVIIYTSSISGDFGTTFISENVFQILGYEASKFTENTSFWMEHTHTDDINNILSDLPKIFVKEFHIYESRFLHADGTYRWIQNELKLVKNKDRKPVEIIGSIIDITERKLSEKALNEANERIINIFLDLEECYFSKDVINDILLNISPAFEKIYGLPVKEFINDPNLWLKMIHKDDQESLKKDFDKFLPGKTLTGEYRIINSNGETRWIKAKFNPIFNTSNLSRIDGIISDITEQKLVQEKWHESEALFRNSFDHAAIGMAIIRTDGRFLRVNNSLCEMLGYSEDELLSENFPNLTYPDDLDLSNRQVQYLLEGKSQTLHFEKRYVHKSGSIVWIMINTTLNRDKAGKPIYFITHLENITQRKISEEKLREQADLLDITTDAICVIDMTDITIYWNKGAEILFGYKKEEVLDNNASKMLFKKHLHEYDHSKHQTVINGKWHGDLHQFKKNDEEIIVDSKWTLVTDNKGNPKSIMVVNTDITKRRILEAEYLRNERMESIGTLSSGIAHDLNNVLTPMMMSLEILKMRFNDEKGLKLVESMSKSTQHGAALVKQLLTFARGVEVNHTTLEIDNILIDVNKIISVLLPKNISLINEIPENLKKISGDRTQLNQVIMNLLVNARDAMPEGGVIKISAKNIYLDSTFIQMNRHAKIGYYVLLIVSDTGTGIPQKIIDKIFEPFFTTKALGKGTGLGLSTTIGIIKSHGGFINLNSKEGRGTEFNIYLPVSELTEDNSTINDFEEIFKGNGETILLIEDEDSIIEAATQTLEQFNYNILKACDGVEGLTVYLQNQEKISLVITDIMLPLMDGHQTIKAILKLNPLQKFIVMSGHEQTENIQQIGNQIKFINKPFTANTLLIALHEHLNG